MFDFFKLFYRFENFSLFFHVGACRTQQDSFIHLYDVDYLEEITIIQVNKIYNFKIYASISFPVCV